MHEHLKEAQEALGKAGKEILAEIAEDAEKAVQDGHLKEELADHAEKLLHHEKRTAVQSFQNSSLKFIFVHGLSGWGSYSTINKAVPYWGFFSGNLVKFLNQQGYDCHDASVDPFGSAWDRACELYAQLAGKVTDYGKVHSEKANHPRFGKDFSGHPLIPDFDSSRIVLIGHSFGGATVRLFSELLLNGSEEERKGTGTDDLSDFFAGGHKGMIHALVTLAAPSNGTTAYNLYDATVVNPKAVSIPEEYLSANFFLENMKHANPDKATWDYADYDMHIDNALALNERISTFPDVYYFAYPCASSRSTDQGGYLPDTEVTSKAFLLTAYYMCTYQGTTPKGVKIGKDWQPNDGLVNEISARAPSGAPSIEYKQSMKIHPGIWHVMPTVTGDHMFLVGGMTKLTAVDLHPFYVKLLDKIISLEK